MRSAAGWPYAKHPGRQSGGLTPSTGCTASSFNSSVYLLRACPTFHLLITVSPMAEIFYQPWCPFYEGKIRLQHRI